MFVKYTDIAKLKGSEDKIKIEKFIDSYGEVSLKIPYIDKLIQDRERLLKENLLLQLQVQNLKTSAKKNLENKCNDRIKYDKQHDILHVFLGSPINAFAKEEYPDVYVSRDEDTNDIVELTIIDFKKKKNLLDMLLNERR